MFNDLPKDVKLRCESLYVSEGDQTNGAPSTWTTLSPSQYDVVCDENGFTLKVNQIAQDHVIRVVIRSTPTAGLSEATNTWSLTANQGPAEGVATSPVYSADGTGAGESPAPSPTSSETPDVSTNFPEPTPSETPVPEVTESTEPAPSSTCEASSTSEDSQAPETTDSTQPVAATSAHDDCGTSATGNQNPGLTEGPTESTAPEMPALVAEAEDHNPATSGENTPNYVPAEGTAETHTATPCSVWLIPVLVQVLLPWGHLQYLRLVLLC